MPPAFLRALQFQTTESSAIRRAASASNSCQPPNIAMGLAVPAVNRQVTVYRGPLDIATFPAGRAVALTTVALPGTHFVRIRPGSECGVGPSSNEVRVQVP